MPPNPAYPAELRDKESDALKTRRERARLGTVSPIADGTWSDEVTGVGLSGGGIRSSTFNLGILQAFARKGPNQEPSALRRIDFLSTASGGGYVGSFIGRWFDRLREPICPVDVPAERVEEGLVDPDSPFIAWLRKSGNYISPRGGGDTKVNLATVLRNFLSMHFVVGVLMFAIFGMANTVRYVLFDKVFALGGFAVAKGDLPIGHLIEAALGPFFSPWFVLSELLLLFLVLPRIIGYWLASQDEHERFSPPALAITFLLITALLFLSVRDGLALEPLFLAASLIVAFFFVEDAWRRGRKREAGVGSGGASTQRLRTRNFLTYDLGLALAMTGIALSFAFVDTIAHALQQWWIERSYTYAAAFAGFGAALAAALPVVQVLTRFFAQDKASISPPTFVLKLKKSAVAGVLALVLLALPLIFYAFTAHAVFQGGTALGPGIAATVFALIISLILALLSSALTFVNRSSLAQTYAARLARAFLGASNPLRRRPRAANITEVMPGDDIPSIREYRPHEAGGPLHLINVIVNQTLDFTSLRGNRDRKGENLAVTSIGMSIGKKWHSSWADSAARDGRVPTRPGRARLEPIGHVPGTEHPLVDATGAPANEAETLSLRRWMSISGAAIAPGRGQTTQLGTALLFGMANFRTGWWWDSGVSQAGREGLPTLTFMHRLLYLVLRLFLTQTLLLMEWTAMFPGPWRRLWYLSDGGFFDNLAGYELIRRRVPRIILCDGTADPNYELDAFANLVRKARIDFDACIEPFADADLKAHVPKGLTQHIGSLEDLKPERDSTGKIVGASKKHAALFWVLYNADQKRRSVLLYLKASLTRDESADVENYHAEHWDFPHESTGDQFFDEAQWESYRKLGEHVAAPIFRNPAWFWDIPLMQSKGDGAGPPAAAKKPDED